jgi:hypothetical protein
MLLFEKAMEQARTLLGGEPFERVLQEGRAMILDEAAECLLQESGGPGLKWIAS